MKGLDIIGADYDSIVSTIFQAAGGGIDYARQADAEGKASVSAAGALSDVIVADSAATSAIAKAATSALVAKADPTKTHVFAVDKAAADKAIAVQDKAGAALPEEKRADRIKAAQGIVDNATKKLTGTTGTAKLVAQAYLDAANMTLAKAKGGDKKDKGKDDKGESFFTKSLVGGFKVWHGLVAVLAAGVGVIAWKKFHHK